MLDRTNDRATRPIKSAVGSGQIHDLASAAQLLGISRRALRERLMDGEITYFKLGTASNAPLRIFESALIEYLMRCQRNAAASAGATAEGDEFDDVSDPATRVRRAI